MEAVKTKRFGRKKVKPQAETISVLSHPPGLEESKLDLPHSTEIIENENGNSAASINIETESKIGSLTTSFHLDDIGPVSATLEVQSGTPADINANSKSKLSPTPSTNGNKPQEKVEAELPSLEGQMELKKCNEVHKAKPLNAIPQGVVARKESFVSCPPPFPPEKLQRNKGWQKFAARFRRSREKRKEEDFLPRTTTKPSKSSTLDCLARQQSQFHHNPKHPHFRNVQRKDSTLPVCPASALLPFEDSLDGEEYSRSYLWELYNSMDNFLDTVFSSAPSGLRRYYSMLPPNSQVVHRISEASKGLRTFRFFLWNLLGSPYGESVLLCQPSTYKISGMDIVESILNDIEVSVRESLAELYRYDVPVVVRTRLVSGLEKIKGTVARKDPPNPVADCKHLAGFAYPRCRQTLASLGNPKVITGPNSRDTHKKKNSQIQIQERFYVPEIPNFKRPTASEQIKKGSESVSTVDASADNGNAANTIIENEKTMKAKEYVPLPHSWDELLKLITAEESGNETSGSSMPILQCTKTTSNNDKKMRLPSTKPVPRVELTYRDQEDVDGELILPSFTHRHHTHLHSAPILKSQTLKCPRDKRRHTMNAAILRNRLKSDAMFSESSSSSEESCLFPIENKLQPSTTLENVSAEVKGWARRKSQQLTQAKQQFIKLFKKN